MFLNLKVRFPRIQQGTVRRLVSLLALVMIGLAGCAPAAAAVTTLVPTMSQQSGNGPSINFTEIALVEQSTDNPTHVDFQNRVVQAMTARQSGWHLPGPQEAMDTANRALAPFGYDLAVNPNPPFSSYALYHGDQIIQSDIARFWPVSVKNGGGDFLLAYQTTAGNQWIASRAGLQAWPSTSQNTPPVYYGNEIAYAATGSGAVSVYAGGGTIYSGEEIPNTAQGTDVRNFVTWSSTSGADAVVDHWALEMDHDIILDGQDLVKAKGYSQAFGLFILNGQPLYFYVKNGLTHINYAGKNAPYAYDVVVHQNSGATAIFNPGGNENTVWFYALRDGVWYYVEAGVNQ